jgi:hypothetical protein
MLLNGAEEKVLAEVGLDERESQAAVELLRRLLGRTLK